MRQITESVQSMIEILSYFDTIYARMNAAERRDLVGIRGIRRNGYPYVKGKLKQSYSTTVKQKKGFLQ